MITKPAQQRQNEKRRNEPRLSPMFLSQAAMTRLDELAVVYGSKKAVIEYLLLNSCCNTIKTDVDLKNQKKGD